MDRPLYDAQFDKDYCDALGEIAFLEDQAEADREFGKLFRETGCDRLAELWEQSWYAWCGCIFGQAPTPLAALRALAAKTMEGQDADKE